MIVPQYWAESTVKHKKDGKQLTVRRFGWSDNSQEEAQANADERAREALQRILSGEKLHRREPKIAYNGAHGVPIREEIIERHGKTIITRNGYGARCLNTANTLFADIDYNDRPSAGFTLSIVGFLILGSVGFSYLANPKLVWITLFIALFTGILLANIFYRSIRQMRGGDEKIVIKRIKAFASLHPEWNMRLYRTPSGMRVLVTHRLFSPDEPEVEEFFRELKVDPVYALMCRNQQCFRARVSAKPWRIGITDHMRPRPGVWPVAPERIHLRESWVSKYESAARSFAACSLITDIGSGTIHPDAGDVMHLHDKLSKVESGLPIA